MKEEILKIIDEIIKEKTKTADRSMSFYCPAQLEVLNELREKVSRVELPVIVGLRHKYSGEDSRLFWKYVAASGERKDEFYSLGVALQNLEEFVLKLMKDACPNFVESKQASE